MGCRIVKTYQYLNKEHTVVAVIDDDSVSRGSCLASTLPEWTAVLSYVAPIPTSIEMRQGRRALLAAGLLSKVDGAIAAMPSPTRDHVQIDWEFSPTVNRNNDLVKNLASALGLTDRQVDDLFVSASLF